MLRQRVNARDPIVLLLLNPLEVTMTMFAGCPCVLRHQSRFRESLLQPLHTVIDLFYTLAYSVEPGLLTDLLRPPLYKLRVDRARFLIKPLPIR